MKKPFKSKRLTPSEFKQTVLFKRGISVIKFYATWSGKCQIAMSLFCELGSRYQSEIEFYTMDIDKCKTAAYTYSVNELPHILFFKDGELVDQAIGTVPHGLLEMKILNILQT